MDLRILRCLSELHDVIGIRDGWIMVHGWHPLPELEDIPDPCSRCNRRVPF